MSGKSRNPSVSSTDDKGSLAHIETAETTPSQLDGTETQSWAGTPEEKKLVRKLDMRIMPILCILYLFAYLDRTNLGNARLQGFPEDTLGGDPTGVLYDWVNSAFFFSYILCQIPATIASKLVPLPLWMGLSAVLWGLSSTLMATGFNFPGMIVARIFLGAFESCFSPGIPLYLSLFYTKHELGTRMAAYFSFASLAGAFGGLIAFGVQHIQSSISNWRLLFIIEGVPTVVLGFWVIFLLPDRPETTRFLSEQERVIQKDRMCRGVRADVGRVLTKKHIGWAFRDWRLYVAGVIYFGANCAISSIAAFLPTIITTFGVSNASAQLLTVPPYAVNAVLMTATCYLSDRLQSRGLFMTISGVVAGVGYIIMLVVPDNNHARYFAIFCVTCGAYTTIGIIIAWFAHNLGSETKKAAGMPLYMAIGQCGAVLGSHLFPLTEGPQYIRGFGVSCALVFLSAVGSAILSISYRIENTRRDRLFGVADRNINIDTTQLADKAPMFRYIP
ncbi:MFS general substrate transporter [Panus rudis PR-1116 ss-1]|nr:MFS general substrate transporter [Panus rudis PR-1116 ss-1]